MRSISTLGLQADGSLVGDREIFLLRRIHRRTGEARGRRSAGLAALFTVEHDGEVDQCEHGDDSGDPADDR